MMISFERIGQMELEKRAEKEARVKAKIKEMANIPPSETDPNGSYTGKPADKFDKPVQDADDL